MLTDEVFLRAEIERLLPDVAEERIDGVVDVVSREIRITEDRLLNQLASVRRLLEEAKECV